MDERTPYVVIGSSSFTGSHIVDALLADGLECVVGVGRSPEANPLYLPYARWGTDRFMYHQIDLVHQADELVQLLDDMKPACVINVAALSEVEFSNHHPVEYFQTNCLGIVKLCNHLRTKDYLRKYIHISTAEVYGSSEVPLDESAPLWPSTPYAVSKAATDMYLATLRQNFDFPVTLVRSTNVYGRYQQLFKIIPRTAIYLNQKKTIELHGGGNLVRSWLHVRDVASGILAIARLSAADFIYHFTDSNSPTIRELVAIICQMMGYEFEEATKDVAVRLGQDSRYTLNDSKARTQLGWAPAVPFFEGIQEVVSWISDNWAEIVREPHVYVHKQRYDIAGCHGVSSTEQIRQ